MGGQAHTLTFFPSQLVSEPGRERERQGERKKKVGEIARTKLWKRRWGRHARAGTLPRVETGAQQTAQESTRPEPVRPEDRAGTDRTGQPGDPG